jgi:hypothetical protein
MASNRQFDTAFDERQHEIKNLIVSNNVLILTSDTGLGKTTRVPLYMIELFTRNGLNNKYKIKKIGSEEWVTSNTNNAEYGNNQFAYDLPYIDNDSIVLCTQPKELLAKENGNKTSHINKSIQNVDGNNNNIISFRGKNGQGGLGEALTFTTSGWLVKYMINNPYLNNGEMNVSCVIVDEAHERSLEIDLLLGLLKKVLLVRPEFKLVIMSATIKKELFIDYFYNAPDIHIEKTLENNNPVTIEYLNSVSFNYIYSILEKIDEIIKSNQIGDIIVFISGIDDLVAVSKGLQYIENIERYKLFYVASGGNKQFDFQTNAFKDVEMDVAALKKIADPKIFFATNAVESSITIESLRFVIDSGVSQQSNYDSKIDMNFLTTLPITKASADQRKGRVGRVAPGTCYRLYTESFFKSSMKESTLSDILKTNIENVFIQMLCRGVNFLNFDYIEPPTEEQTFYTMKKLIKYGIIDDNFNIYTDVGTTDLTMARKYDDLHYIDGYAIPNILLHIILTYTGEYIDLLIQVILLGSLYLESHKGSSKFNFKNLENNNNNSDNNNNLYSDFFLLYEKKRQQMQSDPEFKIFYSNFVNNYNEYSDLYVSNDLKVYDINSLDDFKDLIGHINDILSSHGNICNYGVTTYNDNGNDYNVYFKTNFIDKNAKQKNNAKQENNAQQEYTYVSCILKNNSFIYNLLTRM